MHCLVQYMRRKNATYLALDKLVASAVQDNKTAGDFFSFYCLPVMVFLRIDKTIHENLPPGIVILVDVYPREYAQVVTSKAVAEMTEQQRR